MTAPTVDPDPEGWGSRRRGGLHRLWRRLAVLLVASGGLLLVVVRFGHLAFKGLRRI